MGAIGRYQLEAAVQSAHVVRRRTGAADWAAIVQLYDALLALTGSPVVAINRAIAVAETRGPAAGLAALDALAGRCAARRLSALLGRARRAAGAAAATRRRRSRLRARDRPRTRSGGAALSAAAPGRGRRLRPRRHPIELRHGRIDMVPGVASHAVRHHLRLVAARIVQACGVHGEKVGHGGERQIDR